MLLIALLLAQLQPGAVAVAMPTAAAKGPKHFGLTDPATVQPALLLPPPPAAGSAAEADELAEVRRVVAAASPARLAQAQFDADHEDPSAFDAVIGRRLADLPATWALLRTVQNDADVAVDLGKVYFARLRPWAVDPALPHCGKSKKALGSYPSGHSGLGYSVGWALAQLRPDLAPAILARAADYAHSRVVCGTHYPSDTEASHVVGTLVAARLFADPRLAGRIAAARSELVAH